MDKKMCILGTRTTSEEWADMATEIGYDVIYFVENWDRSMVGTQINGVPVIWYEDLVNIKEDFHLACCISTTQRSRYIEQINQLLPHASWPVLIHPSSEKSISPSVKIGNGTLIGRNVSIGAYATIGKNCIVKDGAILGHNSIFGDCLTLAPGANIAGACEIGSYCWIGIGAVVIDHINVGENVLVAAGALVVKDIPSNTTVMGIPAKAFIPKKESAVLSRIHGDKLIIQE